MVNRVLIGEHEKHRSENERKREREKKIMRRCCDRSFITVNIFSLAT